jgi:hypothetical protein
MSHDVKHARLLFMDYDSHVTQAGRPECTDAPPDTIFGGQVFNDIQDCIDLAKFFWNVGKTHKDQHVEWSVEPELDKYMCRLHIHFRTKQLHTKPFPRLCTPYEERNRAEFGIDLLAAREKKVIWCQAPEDEKPGQYTWPDTSAECTKLQDLVTLAKSKLPNELKKWTQKLFDISITYNSSLTPMHADDLDCDGPGHVVQNICLNGDGVLLFAPADNEKAEMEGCYFPPNSQLIFTNHLRYANLHGLFRLEEKAVPLKWGKNPRVFDRIFVTLRWGNCPPASTRIFRKLFPPETPTPKQTKKPKRRSKALASKKKPRSKKAKATEEPASAPSKALPRDKTLAHSSILDKPLKHSPYACPGKPTLITNTNNAVTVPTIVYKGKWTIDPKKKFRLLNAAKVVEEYLVVRVGWYKH